MENKDFLSLRDMTSETIDYLLKLASRIKRGKFLYKDLLEGKSLGLLFSKHSTRTRLSFEAGINQLGGNAIYLDAQHLQLSRGETVEDTARVLSRYLNGLVIRTYEQSMVDRFAQNSSIPIINGLTDDYHPCQALSDLFTIFEMGMLNKDLKFSYIGDSNNVSNSLLVGFSKLGLDITLGCPKEYSPKKWIIDVFNQQAKKTGARLKVANDPAEAAKDAHIIYTDVWISMGNTKSEEKLAKLKKFQVNRKLLTYASENVKVMHCLPAHREQEITSEVMDGKNSIVWDQAENRLHAQKALLVYLYSR
ncbi:MAG: ornithine carbamoyltransferase [Candidatus Humimicrobiaceae bacterium]